MTLLVHTIDDNGHLKGHKATAKQVAADILFDAVLCKIEFAGEGLEELRATEREIEQVMQQLVKYEKRVYKLLSKGMHATQR